MIHDKLIHVLNDVKNIGEKNFIIVTGGIGDFLTINYYLSFGDNINIIFISKQSLRLKRLFYFYYPSKKFYSLYFDFSLIKKPGFDRTDELIKFFPLLKNIKTVNIPEYFSLIREKKLLKIVDDNILTKIFKKDIRNVFNIPENYAIINPYTEDNRIYCTKCDIIHQGLTNCGLTRNFVLNDYKNIFCFLKEKNITGVIISVLPINIPDDHISNNLINLSNNKIDIIDCIELVKQCDYFFGIDSVFSVIASKILPPNNIYVKCNNTNGYNNKDLYWFPNKNINLQSYININY
jgi:hypothetical protein